MLLRFATPADAPALLEIYAPYVENTSVSFETEAPSLGEFTRRIEDITAAFPYLVAEEHGEILGYAYAHPYHERAAFRYTVETSIYVRQELLRSGIGTKLYEALLQFLTLQGVETACALVTLPNERSIAFHEKLGFHVGGSLPKVGYKFGNWYGLAYLYNRLRDAGQTPGPLLPISQVAPGKIQAVLEGIL